MSSSDVTLPPGPALSHPAFSPPAFSPPAPARPTRPDERIDALDAARGYALLGILLVNIQSFGEPFADFIRLGPETDEGPLTTIAYYFVKTLCEGKFFTLFSTLFGMGLALQFLRASAKGLPFRALGLRRLGFLGLLGFLHATLLWYGDILFMYSVCGLIFFACIKWPARRLLILAAVLLSVATLMHGCYGGVTAMGERTATQQTLTTPAPSAPPTENASPDASAPALVDAGATNSPAPSPAATPPLLDPTRSPFMQLMDAWKQGNNTDPQQSTLWRAAEVAATRDGPFLDALAFRVMHWLLLLLVWTLLGGPLWIIAMFALGAALLKLDLFSDARRPLATRLAVVGLGAGLGLAVLSVFLTSGAPSTLAFVVGFGLSVPAGALMAVGTLCLASLAVRTPAFHTLTSLLRNTGRLALTNYLMQTLLCTFVFYHWGLEQFDHFTRAQRIGLVVVIYVAQVAFSWWYVKHFRMGPMEWLWRSVTYWSRQPFRKNANQPVPTPDARN